jgi:hypothetical protein
MTARNNYVTEEHVEELFASSAAHVEIQSTIAREEPFDEPQGEVLKNITDYFTLASFLRTIGALTVIGAMSSFLLADWEFGNDMQRFYLMLAQTGLLTAGGFGMSFLLKENKGARVFFSLGLLSITANMATLGALIFSIYPIGNMGDYSSAARWIADPAQLSLAIAAGIAAMVPVIVFGHMILARRSVKMLAILGIMTNLLILIPVRESLFVGVIAMIATIVPLYFIKKRMKEDSSLKTVEGGLAIATIFAPVVIILSRTLAFYELDMALSLMLTVIAYAGLRTASQLLEGEGYVKSIIGYASVAVAVCMAYNVGNLVNANALKEVAYMASGLVFFAITRDIITRHTAQADSLKTIAALAVAICFISANASSYLIISLISGLAGVGLVYLGFKERERSTALAGTAIAASALVKQIYLIATFAVLPIWAWLAVVGISALVISSIIERHGEKIKYKWLHVTSNI